MKNVINLIGIFLCQALLFSSCNRDSLDDFDKNLNKNLSDSRETIVGDWFAFTTDGRFVDIITFDPSGGYTAHEYSVEGNVTIDSKGNVNADFITDNGIFNGSWSITEDELTIIEDGKGGNKYSYSQLNGKSSTGKVLSVEENEFIVEYSKTGTSMSGEVVTIDEQITFIRLNSRNN